VPMVGEDDDSTAHEVPKSLLVQIIQARIEETLELVRSHLEASGFAKQAGRRIVLTGGASQLEGVRDLAELVLDKQVRLGRPRALRGLPESLSGPAFSTAAGLLRYGLREHVARPDFAAMEAANKKVYNVPTLPYMLAGATDMAFLRAKGMQCYGVSVAADEEDALKGFAAHSDQERVLEDSLYKYLQFQWEVLGATAFGKR